MSNERRCTRCEVVIDTDNQYRHQYESTFWYVAWLAGFCSPTCAQHSAKWKVAEGKAWWQRSDEVKFELPPGTFIEPGNYTVKVKAVRDDVNGPVVELVELKKETP